MTLGKSQSEHDTYFREIVRLKLWFMWRWLREHPQEPAQEVLRERVDLFRKTPEYLRGPANAPMTFATAEWPAVEAAILACYAQHGCGAEDGAAFEEAAFTAIWPTYAAAAQLVAASEADGSYLSGVQCGSLRYDDPPKPEHRAAGVTNFHITNGVRPKSIFEDRQYLPDCLDELMRQTESRFQATRLYTGTWLNSHPRWLELFPPAWQANLTPAGGNQDVRWHLGFWGQFINARGGFNGKLGAQLRATGRMPYAPRESGCSFAELRAHLAVYRRGGG